MRLHQELDERARHDDTLLVTRSTLFAAMLSAVVGAEVFAAIYVTNINLAGVSTPLDLTAIPFAGAYFSLIWGFVTERTIAGQRVWREMVMEVERRLRPFAGPLIMNLPRETGLAAVPIELDLSLPVGTHSHVFHGSFLRWYLRIGPNDLSILLPYASAAGWILIPALGAVLTSNAILFAPVAPAAAIIFLRLASYLKTRAVHKRVTRDTGPSPAADGSDKLAR